MMMLLKEHESMCIRRESRLRLGVKQFTSLPER